MQLKAHYKSLYIKFTGLQSTVISFLTSIPVDVTSQMNATNVLFALWNVIQANLKKM